MKKLLYLLLFLPLLATAQTPSTTENYVVSKTYKTKRTSVSTLSTVPLDSVSVAIQYFDGLGRPKQSVAIRAGGNKQDIITHIGYDDFGRQEKEYLPYADGTNNAAIRTGNIESITQTFYQNKYPTDFTGVSPGNVNAYSQKRFDNSPLNRVLKQAAPGKDWKLGAGNEIEFDYQTNTGTEVKLFGVTTSFANNTYTPTLTGGTTNYGAGQLYKTITRDENHSGTSKDHTTEEFKNKQGQVVLKRTYNGEQKHDTYYIYDDFGNLTYVLPPKASEQAITTTVLNELCYQYKYDYRNRLVEKKIPGKGRESIIYDKLDRPVLTQDAVQKPNKKWLFTKYDVLGRVVYTGIYTHATDISRLQMQNDFDAVNNTPAEYYEEEEQTSSGSLGIYYSNSDFPNASLEVLTVNYYDNYDFNPDTGISVSSYGISSTSRLKGLATGSRVKVLGEPNWITTVTYYDDKARPIYVYSKNDYLETTDIIESKLDFVGKVLETRSTHQKTGKETIVTIDTFTYDHQDRLLSQQQCIGDETLTSCANANNTTNTTNVDFSDPMNLQGEETFTDNKSITLSEGFHVVASTGNSVTFKISEGNAELIVANTYDELGQLKSKKVGNTATAPLQTVDYAYNVRGWLKKINQDNTTNDNDLFNFTIKYNDIADTSKKLFNGNISQTQWNSLSVNTSSNPVSNEYTYTYDALNRITSAIDNTNQYNVGDSTPIEYDLNGNIKKMQRKRVIDADDNFTYNYLKNGINTNQLMSLSGTTSGSFTYDLNGNMKTDTRKGITNIIYNHLNLPDLIEVKWNGDSQVKYVYDAMGNKLRKIVSSKYEIINTDYAGNYVYEGSTLQFFNHPEGYVKKDANGFKYVYQYKDHLGNVRLSYTDNNNDGIITPSSEIIEESNYYPFGLKHKGYNNVTSSNGNSVAQKWGFGGKELSEELGLNTMDFGTRNYDASLGRWMNIDPLAEQYYGYSSYNYALNSPIKFTDPDGNIVRDSNGKIVFTSTGASLSTGAQTVNQVLNKDGSTTYTLIDRNYQQGNIYADNGTAIEAYSLVSATQRTVKVDKNGKIVTDTTSSVDNSKYDCEADCHGNTFGDNKIWINDDQVESIIENDDNYLTTGSEDLAEITVFKNNKGKVVHSAVRNSNGTYDDNAGIETTQRGRTLLQSSRGLINGKTVANTGNKFKGNINFYFKGGSDKVLSDKRINNLGTVSKGVRKITDKKQIAEFLKILKNN